LQTVSYAKSTVECKAAGPAKLDETLRNFGLQCAALKVTSCI